MAQKTKKYKKNIPSLEETGTIHKNWSERIRAVLIYPNTYYLGMSNLGFQTVYHLLNESDHIVCERAFLPDKGENTDHIASAESGRPLLDFDIIAFSISFESDYPNMLTILNAAGIPHKSIDRDESHPLVMAGGAACFINPEPIAEFIDVFLIGEAEGIIPGFFSIYDPDEDKKQMLKSLAKAVPGVYVPEFYKTEYNSDGSISRFSPICDVPEKIERIFLKDISSIPTCSTILTENTTFDNTYLIEASRGCPHGCRFCSAGYIYRPPRFRDLEILKTCMEKGAAMTSRIGLVGAAVSDLPGIRELCMNFKDRDIRISFSSLRADALAPELLETLRQSRVKTATIAPDAGSERMRRIINKGINEEDILNAAETLVSSGIPNIKLYFMIGLPGETMEDVDAVVNLCKKIKHQFLKSSRARGRIGEITVSLNSFVPKPFTPFQWAAMDEISILKNKIKRIKDGLKRIPNVRFNHDVPRHAYIQALLSRGDRRISKILSLSHKNKGNWAKTFKESQINPDYYVYRDRHLEEIFPWDFIDHKILKSYLKQEYQRALEEKTSRPCPMNDSCSRCGVCQNNKTETRP